MLAHFAEARSRHTVYAQLDRWAQRGLLERDGTEPRRGQLEFQRPPVLSWDSTATDLHALHADSAGAAQRHAPVVSCGLLQLG